MRLLIKVIIILMCICIFISCNRKTNNPLNESLPAIRNTVFIAQTSQGESCISPVEKNKTNETPARYMAGHEFGNLGIEVGYQYIGKGQVNQISNVDVYLISFRIGQEQTQYQAVLYEGGNKVVVDRPEIKISLSQEKTNI